MNQSQLTKLNTLTCMPGKLFSMLEIKINFRKLSADCSNYNFNLKNLAHGYKFKPMELKSWFILTFSSSLAGRNCFSTGAVLWSTWCHWVHFFFLLFTKIWKCLSYFFKKFFTKISLAPKVKIISIYMLIQNIVLWIFSKTVF